MFVDFFNYTRIAKINIRPNSALPNFDYILN